MKSLILSALLTSSVTLATPVFACDIVNNGVIDAQNGYGSSTFLSNFTDSHLSVTFEMFSERVKNWFESWLPADPKAAETPVFQVYRPSSEMATQSATAETKK